MSGRSSLFSRVNLGVSRKESNHAAAPALPAAPEIIEVSQPFNFRALFHLCLEKWPLILSTALLIAGIAAFFTLRVPAKYQAKAVLQVQQEEQRLIGTDAVTLEDLRSPEVLNTIVQNVKNSSVLRRVVEINELASDPDFLPGKKGHYSEAKLVRALAGMITVKLRPDTRLIDIVVSHSNPHMAEKLANSVAKEFIEQNLADRFNTTKAANGLLYAEAANLKAKLQKSEEQIQAYKESTQTISIEDRQSIIAENLRDLTRRFTEAQAVRLGLQAELAQINSTATNPAAILALPSVQADTAVAELRKKLVEQEALVAALAVEYQPTFPKLQHAREQLAELEKVLQAFAEKVRSSVQSSYNAALARENNLGQALKQSQAEAMELDRKSVGYNVLMRELQSDRALYDSVLKRLKETDLSKGLSQASIALVEPAMQPSPLRPPALLIIGGAFGLGFLGSLGLLHLLRSARGSIQTVDDAEHLLQLPVWAAIPAEKGSRKKLAHITAEDPASFCSESFRTLRTTASLAGGKNENKILLFTSADPAEGKTFCTLNYAICQAQEGKRTLLIDFDLRKPSIGENFDLAPETPGVTDYLLQKTPFSELLQPSPYPDLFVLPAGSGIPNPAEELAKGSILELLSEASQHFDRIVIDTAPINAVSDTFWILPFADLVCLVVKSGRTPHRAVRRAMELMLRANVQPSGVVLNYLPPQSGRGYFYHYGSKYNYGSYGQNGRAKALLNS
jgi:capsular exopolysaccharide synthesis family protein